MGKRAPFALWQISINSHVMLVIETKPRFDRHYRKLSKQLKNAAKERVLFLDIGPHDFYE